MKKKLIVANWKVNPGSSREAVSLARAVARGIHGARGVEVVLCPPFVFLEDLSRLLKASAKGGSAPGEKSSKLKASLGAQDVFWGNAGPYTGEVSPSMLKSLGVKYVIVGHSERRRLLGEKDEMINKKVSAALKAGLKVILCVGEPAERGLTRTSRGLTRNKKSAKDYVQKQLESDLRGVGLLLNKKSPRRSALAPLDAKLSNGVNLRKSALAVAYEPAWAISTSRSAKPHDNADTPDDAAEMIRHIKKLLNSKFYILNPRVIYGGSVDSRNARGFLVRPEIDGALVGGASLKPKEFGAIVRAAAIK